MLFTDTGSALAVDTTALLVIDPLARAVTFVTIVMVSAEEDAIVMRVHTTVPVMPTAGFGQVTPVGAETLLKVTVTGSAPRACRGPHVPRFTPSHLTVLPERKPSMSVRIMGLPPCRRPGRGHEAPRRSHPRSPRCWRTAAVVGGGT